MDSNKTDTTAATTATGPGPNTEGNPNRPEAAAQAQAENLSGAPLMEFRCIRNAAYHEDREMYYARAHRGLMFVVVFVGTVSIGASLVHDNGWATAGTAIAVLAGLIDLLWNVDGMARLHSSLRRRCFDLLARLEAKEPLDRLQAEYIRIIADEPPAMHAVNALAFNAAVDAMGRPKEHKYKLKSWQIILRNWIRFQPNESFK